MKKFVFKATALAIGALVGGSAFAALDLTAVSPVPQTTGTYANELDYSKATGTAIVTGETVKAKLGFGVSDGQNRYIRLDFTGVTFKDTTGWATVGAPAFAGATRVAGGGAGENYVILQVTGAAGAGNTSDTVVTVTLPALHTSAGNSAAPTATYALYETATSAVAAAAGTQLSAAKTGKLFMFASGLKFDVTTASATAIVAESFKKFSGPATTAKFGTFDLGIADDVNGAAVKKATGALTLADLLDPTSKVTVTGDFGAVAALTDAYLVDVADAVPTCAGGAKLGTLNSGKTALTFTPPGGPAPISAFLCYTVSGTKALPVQTINADLNVVPATGATTADVAAAGIGQVKRDGATLVAPFATIHPDYLSRVVLTSNYAADAAVEATVITEDGVSCTSALPYKSTIKAGKQLIINTKDICGALSTGTRFAVQVTVAAPANSINGAYNVMNYNQTTGATDSLITYVMTAPGVAATQP